MLNSNTKFVIYKMLVHLKSPNYTEMMNSYLLCKVWYVIGFSIV